MNEEHEKLQLSILTLLKFLGAPERFNLQFTFNETVILKVIFDMIEQSKYKDALSFKEIKKNVFDKSVLKGHSENK